MSASEQQRAANAATWDAVITHQFCAELADGSLPLAKMRAYLIQDYAFLHAFTDLLRAAIANAPSEPDAAPMAEFLELVTGPENTYFLRSFEALGISDADWQNADLWPVTVEFRDVMASAAASGDYHRMITVLMVAEWTYLGWATPFNPPKADLPFYFAEWITLHAGAYFESVVAHLRAQFDASWSEASEAQRADIAALLTHVTNVEQQFFDASYAAA